MPSSDFIFLLARQRSGTKALGSVLATHPDIFTMPEVFLDYPSPDSQLEVDTNYINFLSKRAGGDLRSVLAVADHRELFLEFLDYLRTFSDKRFMLVDVKYNSAHHVTKYWRFIGLEPFLFTLLKGEGIRVLNLTRRNYLRYLVSEVKAQLTQSWVVYDERVVGQEPWYRDRYANHPVSQEVPVRLDLGAMFWILERCRVENEIVATSFAGYPHYHELEYADLFSELGAPVGDDALRQISEWLGVAPDFAERRPQLKKQSAMPLAEAIENYAEVVAALTGTPFEYCLEDEPMYRASAVATTSEGDAGTLPARPS